MNGTLILKMNIFRYCLHGLIVLFVASCDISSTDNTERTLRSMHHNWEETPSEAKQLKDDSFESAREMIPGSWISKEKIFGDRYQSNLLLFLPDGTLKFAQGASNEQAYQLAQESTLKGTWNILDGSQYLDNLKKDHVFLLAFELEGVGSEVFRVEIDSNKSRMGRNVNEHDRALANTSLFTFGGQMFYQE